VRQLITQTVVLTIAAGQPGGFDPKDLVVRHSGPAAPLVSAVREIVRAADPEQPISNVRTMEDVLAGDTAPRRAQLQVLGVLAVVVVLLSSVGIYGLLAYTVSQRSQEIGASGAGRAAGVGGTHDLRRRHAAGRERDRAGRADGVRRGARHERAALRRRAR
jgi:hypothetical protein